MNLVIYSCAILKRPDRLRRKGQLDSVLHQTDKMVCTNTASRWVVSQHLEAIPPRGFCYAHVILGEILMPYYAAFTRRPYYV